MIKKIWKYKTGCNIYSNDYNISLELISPPKALLLRCAEVAASETVGC